MGFWEVGVLKPFLPYNALLVLAVFTMGIMVSYNLALRETFGMQLGYALPQPSVSQSEPLQSPLKFHSDEKEKDFSTQEEEEEFEETDTPDRVVVLASFPLDINKATLDELVHVPKVGSATAQRILQYREQLGGYTRLEQLKEIKGIGDKTFEVMAPYLYIEGEGESQEGESNAWGQETME